jgi:N-hydroxyarylamine O-acetyltransferase
MDEHAYLERIGYRGPREPTAETLRQLHQAHLLAVPFENLDIHLGQPIVLSLSAFYEKIVRRRRGGFCYELNGLFGWLLERLGFTVTRLSARVFAGAQPGPDFDHLVLLVETAERLLADVGFGDSFLEPLRLDSDEASVQRGSSYRLTGSGQERVLERLQGSDWEARYVVSLTPRRLHDFAAMCQYHQTSPDSIFTRMTICSLATAGGRITLSNDRLITTTAGGREERVVTGDEEYRALLKDRFGMDLGGRVQRDGLLAPAALPRRVEGNV